MDVDRAVAFPKKPAGMTRAKREAYFAKVRLHAEALLELIEDTKFSANSMHWKGMSTEPVDPEKLSSVVVRDLADWGEDEQGHIVAYYVSEDGVGRAVWIKRAHCEGSGCRGEVV
jgi:hypothetical protein